ncbi:MAG: hypothetical protein WD269_11080 [Acidimicrobiia bacterium]
MLRRFLYLDATALSQYVGALEGGLVTDSTRRSMQAGSAEAGVDVKLLRAGGERSRQDEDSTTIVDTDEARFDRLLRAAEAEPEVLDWVEVSHPDDDLTGIRIGQMVSWTCELFIPEVIQVLASSGEARDALEMMQQLIPSAQKLGLDTDGLPDANEMNAMSNLISGLRAKLVVVGEDDDMDWRVAGYLMDEFRHAEIDGLATIVGKVSKLIQRDQWQPFLTFPGMNLVSRMDRKRMESTPPPAGEEDQYLQGPAVMIDVLAIYR